MSFQLNDKAKKYCIFGIFITQFFFSMIFGYLIGKIVCFYHDDDNFYDYFGNIIAKSIKNDKPTSRLMPIVSISSSILIETTTTTPTINLPSDKNGDDNNITTTTLPTTTTTTVVEKMTNFEVDNLTRKVNYTKKTINKTVDSMVVPENRKNKYCNECEPKYVYIHWSVVRNYLVAHQGQIIPNIFDAKPLPIRRCLYYMSLCSSNNNYYCMLGKEKYTTGNITLFRDGNVYGYIELDFLEEIECECRLPKGEDFDGIEYPWDMTPIVRVDIKRYT